MKSYNNMFFYDNDKIEFINEVIKPLQSKGLFNCYEQKYKKNLHIHDEHLVVNTVMPPGILTFLSPDVIEFYAHKQTSEELIGPKQKKLDWTDNTCFYNIIEYSNVTSRYGDFTRAPLNDFNFRLKGVGHYRFQAGVRIGDIERAQTAKLTNNDAMKMKINSALGALQRRFNEIAFFGAMGTTPQTSNSDVHGICNSPLLNPVVQENKKLSVMTDAEVLAFFKKYVDILSNQTGGHFTEKDELRVGLSPAAYNALLPRWNAVGRPITEQLRLVYTNIKFIKCPELENAGGAGSDMAVFIGERPDIGGVPNTVVLGYSELAMFSEIVQDETSQHFKIMAGSHGCIFYKPSLISRCKGI